MQDDPRVHAETREDWRAWLAEHHGSAGGVWLVSWRAWDGFPRSARRGILEWVVQAKRAETRERRVAETAEKASRGERADQWRPAGR